MLSSGIHGREDLLAFVGLEVTQGVDGFVEFHVEDCCSSFGCSVAKQRHGVVIVEDFEGVGRTFEVEVVEQFAAFGPSQIVQQVSKLCGIQ